MHEKMGRKKNQCQYSGYLTDAQEVTLEGLKNYYTFNQMKKRNNFEKIELFCWCWNGYSMRKRIIDEV